MPEMDDLLDSKLLPFSVGNLKAGREEGSASQSIISIPFTTDENGNSDFDEQKWAEIIESQMKESTKKD